MKPSHLVLSLFLILLSTFSSKSQRLERSIHDDWKFRLNDDTTAYHTQYDDSDWETVEIPHDWSFENGTSKNGAQKANGGYFSGGIAWYRKNITVPSDWKDKRIYIEFDGVYMNSEVWINGHYLGKRPYGYIRFRYDLSEFLRNGSNTISVRVDNSLEPSARWYHPAGIYAPVRLIVTDKQFIQPNGVYITSDISDAGDAEISIVTNIENQEKPKRKSILETAVIDHDGKVMATVSNILI